MQLHDQYFATQMAPNMLLGKYGTRLVWLTRQASTWCFPILLRI